MTPWTSGLKAPTVLGLEVFSRTGTLATACTAGWGGAAVGALPLAARARVCVLCAQILVPAAHSHTRLLCPSTACRGGRQGRQRPGQARHDVRQPPAPRRAPSLSKFNHPLTFFSAASAASLAAPAIWASVAPARAAAVLAAAVAAAATWLAARLAAPLVPPAFSTCAAMRGAPMGASARVAGGPIEAAVPRRRPESQGESSARAWRPRRPARRAAVRLVRGGWALRRPIAAVRPTGDADQATAMSHSHLLRDLGAVRVQHGLRGLAARQLQERAGRGPRACDCNVMGSASRSDAGGSAGPPGRQSSSTRWVGKAREGRSAPRWRLSMQTRAFHTMVTSHNSQSAASRTSAS
jgi:hypothetical protein